MNSLESYRLRDLAVMYRPVDINRLRRYHPYPQLA